MMRRGSPYEHIDTYLAGPTMPIHWSWEEALKHEVSSLIQRPKGVTDTRLFAIAAHRTSLP
jgi:hypothetical protein